MSYVTKIDYFVCNLWKDKAKHEIVVKLDLYSFNQGKFNCAILSSKKGCFSSRTNIYDYYCFIDFLTLMSLKHMKIINFFWGLSKETVEYQDYGQTQFQNWCKKLLIFKKLRNVWWTCVFSFFFWT